MAGPVRRRRDVTPAAARREAGPGLSPARVQIALVLLKTADIAGGLVAAPGGAPEVDETGRRRRRRRRRGGRRGNLAAIAFGARRGIGAVEAVVALEAEVERRPRRRVARIKLPVQGQRLLRPRCDK